MSKTKWILFAAALAFVYLLGIWTGKAIYDKPINGKVERDTVIVHDTVPDLNPTPKDSVRIKWMTRWLPAKHDTVPRTDTIYQPIGGDNMVAVEVPITQKHYGNDTYDAWVSGFEPSLDSIKVYQRTQLITEIRTISKPPNRWELDVVGGIDYNINGKKYTPRVGGEILYKPNRLQVGIQGGIQYDDKVEPYVGGVVKFRLF